MLPLFGCSIEHGVTSLIFYPLVSKPMYNVTTAIYSLQNLSLDFSGYRASPEQLESFPHKSRVAEFHLGLNDAGTPCLPSAAPNWRLKRFPMLGSKLRHGSPTWLSSVATKVFLHLRTIFKALLVFTCVLIGKILETFKTASPVQRALLPAS